MKSDTESCVHTETVREFRADGNRESREKNPEKYMAIQGVREK
ncbi:hypothetical protein [Methanosarcina acetivorans]|nr:hypothetical protein [Methanosarcina acetivorans]